MAAKRPDKSKKGSKRILWSPARKAAAALLDLIDTPEEVATRRSVLLSELERQGPDVVPVFAEEMRSGIPRRRAAAAYYLIATSPACPAIRKDSALLAEAEQIMADFLKTERGDDGLLLLYLLTGGTVPKRLVRLIEPLLESEDPRFQVCAAAALVHTDRYGPACVPVLGRALQSGWPALVNIAATAMQRAGLKSSGPIPQLIAAFRESDHTLQLSILVHLKQLGTAASEAVPVLFTHLQDRKAPPALRGYAAEVVGHIASDPGPARDALLRALDFPEPEIIRGAAAGLLQLGSMPPAAVAMLARYARSSDEAVFQAAADGLAAAGPAAEPALAALLASFSRDLSLPAKESLVFALAKIGPAAVPRLLEVLKEGNPAKNELATSALWHMGGAGIKAIAELLPDDADESTLWLLVRLARDHGPAGAPAVPVLAERLDQAISEEFAAAIIGVLDAVGPAAAPASAALARCLLRGSEELASWAEAVLRSLGAAAAPGIEVVVVGADPEQRPRLLALLRAQHATQDPQNDKLQQIGDDEALRTFAYVGDLLLSPHPPSLRQAEAIFLERKLQGTMPEAASHASRTLSAQIKRLEAHLGELVDRRPRRKGGLTDAGRQWLPVVKKYLAQKAEGEHSS